MKDDGKSNENKTTHDDIDQVDEPIFTRNFSDVINQEKVYIEKRRLRAIEELSEVRKNFGIDKTSRPFGMAFSGGGIRSASFNFGIVQGLSKFGLLPLVDYLTSVSGGGFTASCLTSLLSLEDPPGSSQFPFNTTWGKFPFNPSKKIFEVEGDTIKTSFEGGPNEQFRHLREKGNYLIPRGGTLSRDTFRVLGSVLGGMGYIITAFLLAMIAISAFHFGLVAFLTGDILTTTEFSITKLFSDPAEPNLSLLLYFLAVTVGLVLSIITALVLKAYYRPGRSHGEIKTPSGLTAQDVRDSRIISRIFWSSLLILSLLIAVLKLIFRGSDQIFWIWMPILYTIGILVGLIIFRIGAGRSRYDVSDDRNSSIWSAPNFRSIFWAYQGFAFYAVIGAVVFTFLALPHFFEVTDPETSRATPLTMTIISGVGAALLTYLNSQKKGTGGALQSLISKIPSGLMNGLLGLLVIVFNLSLIFIFEAAIDSLPGLTLWTPWVIFFISILLFWVVLRFVNINHISPHYFFRDRIGEVFLKTEITDKEGKVFTARDQSDMGLIDINPLGCSAPYHIVVAAINLPGSYDLKYKDRKSQHFNFTRDYNGSEVTGYALHKKNPKTGGLGYRKGATKYARTIAISGAAASSAIGYVTSFAQAFVLTLFNVRLGLWMIHPNRYATVAGQDDLASLDKYEDRRFWLQYLLDELSTKINERRPMVNLSDGGHTGDNGALYPLFQRRCKVIFAGDASQDPKAHCNDLFRVIHYVKVDLGIDVNINVEGLKPKEENDKDWKAGWSKHHCAIGEITYPTVLKDDGSEQYPEEKGWLIYFKPSITAYDRGELKHYWETHKDDFPHPSTIDQFFDEIQFDIQRFLGEFTIEQTINELIQYYNDQIKSTSEEIDQLTKAENLRAIEMQKTDPNLVQMAAAGLEDVLAFWRKKREIVQAIQRQEINYSILAEYLDNIIRDLRDAMA